MALRRCHVLNFNAATAFSTIWFAYPAACAAIVKNIVIRHWNGVYFKKMTLKNIGLHVQLNYTSMNGIHDVVLDYCGCERQLPKHIQLLHRGWYPTSQRVPRMAASFQLLNFLHILSLCAKTSVYDFYWMLKKLMTNTGMGVPKSRYKALMQMLLQWQHLKMLKCGRRGHVPNGVETMQYHDLVVLCPSCLRPGINLPKGWENALPEMQFRYVLLLCMDANFCLKNQMVSSYSRDPGLGISLGYFIPNDLFEAYVLNHTSDKDISTCVGFAALAKVDMKFLKGMRYMGIGTVSCAQGEFLMQLVDLHKGERYALMDYVFGLALQSFGGLLFMIISYDIACQWFVNLHKCMDKWPSEITPPSAMLMPAIPKFHEPTHKQQNHQEFSCNYIKGMGLSDCKVPEHIWGPNNALGNSTKTMGPGSWYDVINDNFSTWNWQKYIGMGKTLSRNNLVEDWERICVAWEDDGFPKMAENPFATNEEYMSEEDVKKELEAEEEEHCHDRGRVYHETSMHKFVALGLSLEELQQKVKTLAVQHWNPMTWQGYHSACVAKLELAGPRDWEETLRILENKDIRSYSDLEHKREPGHRGNNEEDDELVHTSEDEDEELNLKVEE
ncbi:hypothetical protein ARMGADRAFT_1091560 [Armillaria gallica]|uniref:CxC2-like cysteine cluster KDZ transposase-associated domain-containing protein n=1 Tax=Armillaria gallica TaxID=47427 RepID=A0A2H3CIH1_ARMGA|nr:hypothetical protein ARMGADRAFT_1091560 [Armillaria gallica]